MISVRKLLGIFRVHGGSRVRTLLSFFLGAANAAGVPTSASVTPDIATRVASVRLQMSKRAPILPQMGGDQTARGQIELAQFIPWGNWANWANWANFANWANWANWGNFPH
jgi:hypothetical protein